MVVLHMNFQKKTGSASLDKLKCRMSVGVRILFEKKRRHKNNEVIRRKMYVVQSYWELEVIGQFSGCQAFFIRNCACDLYRNYSSCLIQKVLMLASWLFYLPDCVAFSVAQFSLIHFIVF